MRVAEHSSARPRVLLVEDRAAAGIGVLARRIQALAAEEAVAARNREWHDHTIAHAEVAHPGPSRFNDPHEFMAKDVAVLHARHLAAIQMQVRSADRRRGYAQDDVVGLDQGRVGHVFDADIECAVVGKRLHASPFRRRSPVECLRSNLPIAQ
jgi:hypothetical protein